MHRAKWLTGVALSTVLLVTLALGGSAGAQEMRSVELQLTPSRDSGVSGTASLQDVQDGVEVTLNMQGLPEAGIEHINPSTGAELAEMIEPTTPLR